MKILQIAHGFPPEAIAGTETYCEALSRVLLERGHECAVLAGSYHDAPEATLAVREQDGMLVARYQRVKGRQYRWADEYDADAERLVRHWLALVKPDVVHLHHWLYLTNNLVTICADLDIPVVVTLHDVWTSCPRIHRIRWDGVYCNDVPAVAPCPTCVERSAWQSDAEIVRALALRREILETELGLARTVIVPSEAHRRLIVSLLNLAEDRLTVLPHGMLRTCTVPKDDGRHGTFPERSLQIGHWGYLMYQKGTHLILEAVHRLRDPSTVQVHLIGTAVEQEYEERLRQLAQGIPVSFHGAYRSADLPTFDLDVAVFASIASESYSFSLDEALCLGLPVVVSDRGALSERIGAAGLTFRAGDAGDLSARLQEILDTPELLEEMRRNIHPETLFSMEGHVAMLETIYDDAAKADQPTRQSHTPYLKLIAHAEQQVRDREAALADLQSRCVQSERICAETETRLQQTELAMAETETRLQQAQQALTEQAGRLQQTEQALTEKEAALQQAQQALRETEIRLQQTEQAIASLQEEWAQLRRTPLFKLQAVLTKRSQRQTVR